MDYVRWFNEIGAADAGTVGGKGAILAEMSRAGLPVPPGFCLSAGAYRAFVSGEYVDKTVRHILTGLQLDDPEDVEVRTEQIRNFLCAQPMPVRIAQEVLQSYYQLSVESGSRVAPIPVAVRSSAVVGVLPASYCREQQGTFLNVCGEADLLEHVKACWACLWTARAVTSRVKQGVDHVQVALAVVVQVMVQPEVSGVLFAASPLTGRREEMVIIVSRGLGDASASGAVTPDAFAVRKSDGAILEREVAAKGRLIECAQEGGMTEQEAPPQRRRIPALSDKQVAQLVSLDRQIERHFGAPMDIEWAYARGEVYILCRI